MKKSDVEINRGYDNNGAFLKIEVHVPYSELETFKLPKSCASCPCGFIDYRCGRNVPFTDEDNEKRPITCKLEQIFIEDIMKIINKMNE